jgi:lipid A disaccharide synthetase
LWHLAGQWFVKPKYFCLVNLLADQELVPEFVPYFSSIDPIVDAVTRLVEDKNKLREISRSLIDLVEPLRTNRAGDATAKVIAGMLHQRPGGSRP